MPHIIPNALVFVSEGTLAPLNQEPLTIYESFGSTSTVTDISWGSTEGILLHIPGGNAYSDTPYRTEIHWMLIDAP